MKAWIVVLRESLDDVIKGAYASEAEARERMAEVAMEVMAAEPRPAGPDPVAVAIYRASGADVQPVDQVEFDDGRQADAIREFCRGLGWNGK